MCAFLSRPAPARNQQWRNASTSCGPNLASEVVLASTPMLQNNSDSGTYVPWAKSKCADKKTTYTTCWLNWCSAASCSQRDQESDTRPQPAGTPHHHIGRNGSRNELSTPKSQQASCIHLRLPSQQPPPRHLHRHPNKRNNERTRRTSINQESHTYPQTHSHTPHRHR
jgi:hypothetical protein